MSAFWLVASLAIAQKVAWIEHADEKLRSHTEWAINTWSKAIKGASPRPLSVTIQDVGDKHTLGTFQGCSTTCIITIDPRAFPDLVRVTLIHEIGHALGFVAGIQTPFKTIEREFGVESAIWVKNSHWSDAGAGLVMHSHISSDSVLSASAVTALAKSLGATANVCTSNADCRPTQQCEKRSWPLPNACKRAPDKIPVAVLSIITATSATLALLIIIPNKSPKRKKWSQFPL